MAAELAHLYETSRDFEPAAECFLLAARNAARVFANHEAIALARRGLAAVTVLPDTPARAQLELSLQLTLGWPLINTRGYFSAEVEQTFRRAHKLCEQFDEAAQLCEVIWGLAMCYLLRAEYRQTRELATEMLRLARERQDPALQVTAHYTLGTVLFYLGELVASREHFEKGIALCDASLDQRLTMPDGRDPGVSCRAQMARVLWLLGYPDRALRLSVAAETLAQELAQPLATAFALFVDMLLRQFRGEEVHTANRAESLLALAHDHGLPQYAAWAGLLQGWASTRPGQVAGIARIRESLAKQDQMGSVLSRPHFLALLADALARDGQIEAGLTAVAEGLTAVNRCEERYYEAELHRLKGELLQKSGSSDRHEAARCFAQGVEVAAKQGARSLELRAVLSLARTLRHEGRSAEARTMLASIYGWFTDGLDTPDLREAKALLADLADDARPAGDRAS